MNESCLSVLLYAFIYRSCESFACKCHTSARGPTSWLLSCTVFCLRYLKLSLSLNYHRLHRSRPCGSPAASSPVRNTPIDYNELQPRTAPAPRPVMTCHPPPRPSPKAGSSADASASGVSGPQTLRYRCWNSMSLSWANYEKNGPSWRR